MLKSCGPPVDVVDLQFKLQCRLKIFENKEISQFPNATSLVTCASRYGLLFVGTNSENFQVIQTQTIQQHSGTKEKDDYPRRDVQIPSSPKHLSVNCDSTILAVVVERNQCPTVIFYDVLSFLQQTIKIIKEIRLSPTPQVQVQEINWNPAIPAIFTACKSDGSLGVYELKGETVEFNELPTAAAATCFCWSPKGKQIAVGSKDGKITQYKPDLKAVKIIAEPKLEGGCSLISLQWVSNYQFIGTYHRAQDGTSFIIVVDAPKSGETIFTNYEDICYSGSARVAQFYMILQQNWNFLMVASANSTEVGVLSNTGEEWTQWIMSGSARAELPLSPEKEETLPIGITFDISSTTPLPWEESTIPPCPLLCVLSHQGVLHCFNVVYLKPGIVSVCTPPDSVADCSGLSCFVAKKEQPKIIANSTPTKNVTFNFPAASQSTPLAPPKINTNVASKTLFSGQTTLTPIKLKSSPLIAPPASSQPSNLPTFAPPQSSNLPTFSALNPVKPIAAKTVIKQEENQAETDAMLQQMVKDEWTYLESELRVLTKMGGTLKLNVGTDAEKTDMVQQLISLENFVQDAVEISVGQSNEIHCLKQNLLQSWAWYEEAISHYNSSKNEAVALLIKCQPLDTLSEKRLREIKQLDYYIRSQLSEAHKTLDEQWNNFQDYAKKTHKVKMPTMETIFQTMVKQNAILQKQILTLKQISFRLAKTNKDDIVGNLSGVFEDLTLNSQQIRQMQYDKVKSYSKNLSRAKSRHLKDLLDKREITKVAAIKPQISSFAINQSPTRRLRQSISMLGANISPTAKSLSFVKSPTAEKSTPKTSETIIEKSTPMLVKTNPVISSSQGSAFTPIGGASVTSNNQKITTPSFSSKTTFSSIFKPATSDAATFSFGSTNPSTTSALFANKPSFSFSTPSTTTVEVSKAVAKPPSGVASIFANIQSVIDNATTTTTKPSFSSDSGNLFGNKQQTTFSFKAPPLSAKSTANEIATDVIKSEPSKIITVSLFDAKSTASDQIVTESKPIFANSKPLFANLPTITATTTSTLFSTTATTNSIFGNKASTATTTATPSIFASGSTTTAKTTVEASTTATTSTTSFVATTATTTSTSSGFGSSTGAIFGTTPTTSVFGAAATSTTTSVFGTPTTTSVFSTPTTTSSIFGTPTTTTSTSVFGAVATTTSTSVFGTPTTTTSTSVFGAATTSTTTSLFGAPPTATTATSVFGAATTSSSVFGAATPSTAPSAFGTATSSIFGTPATTFGTPTTSSNVFGASSTNSNVFGATSAFGSNVFSPTTTATASIFGGGSSSTFGSQTAPIFGGTPTTTAAGGVFGQAPAFGSQSVFGAAPAATIGSTSVFGQAATSPAASGSIFGSSASTNVFGSGFGSAAPTSNVFGSQPAETAAASSTSNFGFGGLNVGGGSQSSGSLFGSSGATSAFGQSPTVANPFAKVETSAFGASSSSIFGGGGATTSSGNIFGSPTAAATTASSIFGGSNSGGGFGSSTFGSSTFGQPSTFGSSSFGSPQAAPAPGPFSGGASSSASFGAPPSYPGSSAGFGGTSGGSMFGGSTFGTSTFGTSTFGSPSTFGAGPATFGSPGGSGQAATGGFSSTDSTIFGNLANQNTIGFGTLAQQASTPPTSMPFSGGASFSSWR